MEYDEGDKVRIVNPASRGYNMVGVIVEVSEFDDNDEPFDNPYYIEITRDDGSKYSDWFCDDDLVEIKADKNNEIIKLKEVKKEMEKTYKKIEITLERKNGRTIMKLKLPDEFEKFFSVIAKGETQTSEKWLMPSNNSGNLCGVKFFKWGVIPDNETISPLAPAQVITSNFIIRDEGVKLVNNWLGDNFCNNFGGSLIDNGKLNIAPLRAVGTTEGIEMVFADDDNMSNNDFEYYIKELAIKAKQLYQDKIKDATIKAVITFEL